MAFQISTSFDPTERNEKTTMLRATVVVSAVCGLVAGDATVIKQAGDAVFQFDNNEWYEFEQQIVETGKSISFVLRFILKDYDGQEFVVAKKAVKDAVDHLKIVLG